MKDGGLASLRKSLVTHYDRLSAAFPPAWAMTSWRATRCRTRT